MERHTDKRVEFRVLSSFESDGLCLELRDYPELPHRRAIEVENDVGLSMISSSIPILARYSRKGPYKRLNGSIIRPRGIPWEVRTQGGGAATGLVCRFSNHPFEEQSGVLGIQRRSQLEASIGIRSSAIDHSLRMLADETRYPSMANAALIESVIIILGIQIARHFGLAQPDMTDIPDVQAKLNAVSVVRDHLSAMPSNTPRVTELARLCGLSPRKLLKIFKLVTGMTVSAYVAEQRLDHARSLLRQKTLSLKEVSYRLGFSSPAHFSAAFRKSAGISPSEYRCVC